MKKVLFLLKEEGLFYGESNRRYFPCVVIDDLIVHPYNSKNEL